MKTSRILIAALVLSLFALPAAFAKTTSATVHGTIAGLSESGKTFAIHPKTGKNVDLSWTDATKVNHGPLKDGEMATVRYMKRDGKNVATAITIAPPATKAAAKTTAKTSAKTTAKTETKTAAKTTTAPAKH
jgi:hypothetical protein